MNLPVPWGPPTPGVTPQAAVCAVIRTAKEGGHQPPGQDSPGAGLAGHAPLGAHLLGSMALSHEPWGDISQLCLPLGFDLWETTT